MIHVRPAGRAGDGRCLAPLRLISKRRLQLGMPRGFAATLRQEIADLVNKSRNRRINELPLE